MAESSDPLARAQDVKRCQLCPGKDKKSEAEKVCIICHVYLCPECVDPHISDSPLSHDIVTSCFYHFEMCAPHCIVHQDLHCDMFCFNCDFAICSQCQTFGIHKDHNVQSRINPLNRAQDLKYCQICPGKDRKSYAERTCTACNVNFCQNCVDLHMVNTSIVHNIATFRFKYFEIEQLPCMVHQKKKCDVFCKECDVAVCRKCLKSGSHTEHNVLQRTTHDVDNVMQFNSGFILSRFLGGSLLLALYIYLYPHYKPEDKYLWGCFGILSLMVIISYLYRFFKSLGFISRSIGIISLLAICLFLYRYYKFTGEFQFERAYLESIRIGNSRLGNYPGAILKGNLRDMDTFQIGITSEIWNNTRYYDDVDNIIFQIGLVHKDNFEDEPIFSNGIFVSAKYCRRIGVCFTVKNEGTLLVKQKIRVLSAKTYLLGILSFKLELKRLTIYYQTDKPICIPLANISIEKLENYEFIARLGYLTWGRSVMTFHGGVVVSNQMHKEIHASSDGQALANYDIDNEYRGSFANFAIHPTTEFGNCVLEYHSQVNFKHISKYMYASGKEKNLFEIGLAPMNLIWKKIMLRNLKDTIFIQVTYIYRDVPSRRLVFNTYTWFNGKVSSHHTSLIATKHVEDIDVGFIFRFDINLQSKLIQIYIKEKGQLNHINKFKNVEFKTILHPSVGKETSLHPTKISYTIWKS
ncbi:uncharacterized protein LOC134263105 [Saccostrea cucullata]|uniref:uncharacterized protein LOC134263105 n=1 Tax=Saccostrea cuccullata TaxID=36930 RepID=UPI002ED6B1D2